MAIPAGGPPGPLGQDGRWWWDGVRWQPVPAGPFPGPAPRRSTTGRTVAIVVCSVLVVAGLAVGGMVALGSRIVEVQREQADTMALYATLSHARLAEESYRVDAMTYTDDPELLTEAGFVPEPGVELTVIDTSADTFCIGAGAPGGAPTMWATHEAADLVEPCG